MSEGRAKPLSMTDEWYRGILVAELDRAKADMVEATLRPGAPSACVCPRCVARNREVESAEDHLYKFDLEHLR